MDIASINKLLNLDNPIIEVYYGGDDDDDKFISGVIGSVNVSILKQIEDEFFCEVCLIESGFGIYVLECIFNSAEYCPSSYGLINEPYWDFRLIKYKTFDESAKEYNEIFGFIGV